MPLSLIETRSMRRQKESDMRYRQAAAHRQSPAKCPFSMMGLPPELRLMIYRHSLTPKSSKFLVHFQKDGFQHHNDELEHISRVWPMNLMLASKKIHREMRDTWSWFVKISTFVFLIDFSSSEAIERGHELMTKTSSRLLDNPPFSSYPGAPDIKIGLHTITTVSTTTETTYEDNLLRWARMLRDGKLKVERISLESHFATGSTGQLTDVLQTEDIEAIREKARRLAIANPDAPEKNLKAIIAFVKEIHRANKSTRLQILQSLGLA
ncbi:uncharacterized protein MYCFIDRAFT_83350 [Pseudocercospora fijiensis CIRAD86]|uniref:F-box domain-containing protein n=1 Tax=Pseudocercospora fijiensis (strain CIRAD86) TaxID=383855 RepID=M2ZZA6_PSEFD|nr:uncharacterized protein MYCFIDRAFT_83350 [Pseudocercospora fijiensis CIRAD86]EME77496.1 hypothetical protein MYCFIDRAFT_83350 [Pseudocercospora fijiensis CIRAD86]